MGVITFNGYLRKRFGERVQRIPLHAGMTCPNRDGSRGTGGCIYCDNGSFHPGIAGEGSVRQQMERGREWAGKRYKARKYLAYFQTYSNTYAPVEKLRKLFEAAIDFPDVVGLMVATRPDCLEDDTVKLLAQLNSRITVWLELGLQTCHDATLERINRGHDRACAEDAVGRVHAAGIPVAAHVILGLPGETRDHMMKTASWLNEMNVEGVKLHHLHAVKHTRLAELLQQNAWTPLTVDEYVALAVDFMDRLPHETVMMRLVGDCPDELLLAPRWTQKKSDIQRRIWDAYNAKQEPEKSESERGESWQDQK